MIGHPVVAGPLHLVGGLLLVASLRAGSNGLFGIVLVAAGLGRVATANEQVTQYRAWKRAWDGMADTPPRRIAWLALARSVVAVAAVLYGLANFNDPQIRLGMAVIAAAFAIYGVTRLVQRIRGLRPSRRRTKDGGVVSVAVRGPLLPVPTLQQAFNALPEHCLCLLQTADA